MNREAHLVCDGALSEVHPTEPTAIAPYILPTHYQAPVPALKFQL